MRYLIVLFAFLSGCAMTPKEAMLATEEELCTTFFQTLSPNHAHPTVHAEIVRRSAYCADHATTYAIQRNIQIQQGMAMMGIGAAAMQSSTPSVCTNTWNGASWVQVCR